MEQANLRLLRPQRLRAPVLLRPGPVLVLRLPVDQGGGRRAPQARRLVRRVLPALGCADFALALIGLPALAQLITRFVLRQELVRKYNIDENDCTTFCCVFWCGSCAACQQSNEMFEREGLVFDGCTRARRDAPNDLTTLIGRTPGSSEGSEA
uniref:Uncharacterized protein n=1 Tax=Calcidiscus leptoporus TaxID=127549 RepID=A0A7S0JDM8_9EUKA|mmetsp:Transcript_52998/g.121713  ORF Transcript_52998/g.121713 Transcript_52998/m.121713 type:complete len:153 (+) Transcript_52998:370-828(+)